MTCSGVCLFRGISPPFIRPRSNLTPGPVFGGQVIPARSALTKAGLDVTRVSVDDEVVRYGDHIEGLVEAWGAATLEERHQLLAMMLDAVYVDMTQGLVLGLKPKPEFLPLFNLGEPVTTGDAELVTGGMEQSRTTPRTRNGCVVGGIVSLGEQSVESRLEIIIPLQIRGLQTSEPAHSP